MRLLRLALCVGFATWAGAALAGDGVVRLATSRTRQPPAPTIGEPELLPAIDVPGDGDAEALAEGAQPTASDPKVNPFDYGTMQGSGLPASPYIAGLSYMMTPQPFRVPIPDRFYYPAPHYVHRCPYFPKGFYWGANWNRRFLPPNNLVHGDFRFNPYLSRRKTQGHGARAGQHGEHRVCAVNRTASTVVEQQSVEKTVERQRGVETRANKTVVRRRIADPIEPAIVEPAVEDVPRTAVRRTVVVRTSVELEGDRGMRQR